jgi:Hemerythrin HHE cation binding domain
MRWAPSEAGQDILYPALDRVLGGNEPTGPMSRSHVEFAHRVRRLGQLIADIDGTEPGPEDIDDLHRMLYELHTILRLHTVQEEESYLSLGDAPTVDL